MNTVTVNVFGPGTRMGAQSYTVPEGTKDTDPRIKKGANK